MNDKVNIDKKVYNKNQFKRVVDTEFREFFTKSQVISIEQFFTYYDELFFDIPLSGNNSHTILVERSQNYLGEDLFEEERSQLLEQISNLEAQLALLEGNVVEEEHPIFKNGSLLRVDGSGAVYYMDKGKRRHLKPTIGLTKTIIRATYPETLKLNEFDTGDYINDISSDVMEQIEQGPDFTLNDFSGKNLKDKKSPISRIIERDLKSVGSILGKEKDNGDIGDMKIEFEAPSIENVERAKDIE